MRTDVPTYTDTPDDGHTYVCIDLKSFYASVECVERGLDPMRALLAVADPTRGRNTICLAITPAMKALGIRNRCRVYEIPPDVDYVKAQPRMRRYMEVSAQIYGIYLRYVSPLDIHVYSVDECFIDATPYLALYHVDARAFAIMLMDAVADQTGICATAGIGTNLFLAKVALDVTAKHVPDHIGQLDRDAFARLISRHRPITDIWGIGTGIARRLERYGVRDLEGVAACDPTLLYQEFGVNAEFLIDHAHGVEPCTIAQIQAYRPQSQSLCRGQVLARDYTYDECAVVLREMVDDLVLELVGKGLAAGSISLHVGYARDASDRPPAKRDDFVGEHGRRRDGEGAGVTRRLPEICSSRSRLMPRFLALLPVVVDRGRCVRKISVGLGDLMPEELGQMGLFDDVEADRRERELQDRKSVV